MIANSFVGRSRELAQLARLLERSRLVTIMGPPGSGKTRLASEASRRLARRFKSGVFWCELAQVQAPGLVKTSIAEAFGFAREVRGDLGSLVCDRFGDDLILLVIDNCEHLRNEVAATVATLVEAKEDLYVLATSRERLKTPGETAWMLPPLNRDEAIELVANRVASLNAEFELTAENRVAIAEICERLGDLPLAIELVAPHLVLLPAIQVAEMLNDALGLLAADHGPVRQRSISAALDWSAGLLTPPNQEDLWRLAVFPAAFSLDAASAVFATSPNEALVRLGVLRDSSLVLADVSGASARYRLLEPIRQYALHRLVGSPLEAEVRRRHAEHVADRCEWIADRLLGTPEQVAALVEFEERLADIRQAVVWAFDEEPERAVRIAACTGWAWEITGRLKEGEAFQQRALGLATKPADRAMLLNRLGSLISRRTAAGKPEGIDPLAISAAREANDRRELAFALCLASDYRRPDEAAAQLDEAAAIASDMGDTFVLAWERFFRGLVSALTGNLTDARSCFEDATAQVKALGDSWCTSQAISNLVVVCLLLGDHGAAREHLLLGLPILIDNPTWSDAPSFVHHTAFLAARTGRPVDALRLLAAHRRLSEEAGRAWPDTSEIEQSAIAQLAGRSKVDRFLSEGARLSGLEALKLALTVAEQPLPSRSSRAFKSRSELLTRRELEVARLVSEGLTNREIASRLFITERSAEGHVERIRNKLDVRSRSQVAAWSVERDLSTAQPNSET